MPINQHGYMDVERILKLVAALNNNISLVTKGSLLNEQGTELAKLINVGKMIFDSMRGVERPDNHWVKAILTLQKIKDKAGDNVVNFYLDDLGRETKPDKFEGFMVEWNKWCSKDSGMNLPERKTASINRLLKAAEYIQKSADGNVATKIRLARLIESHIGHIIGLIQKGSLDKAKEYLEVIRPEGWERNNERNVDKLYEQVIKGLAEKLPPEEFQALGL
jgi:hypothetical protein